MGEMPYVYLDYAASAPLRPEAVRMRAAYEARPCAQANPNSLHTLGREAAHALDEARSGLARCIGCGFRPSELAFTSGGTESNNLAVIGLAEGARSKDRRRTRVVLSAIEHDSVLDLAGELGSRGFEVRLAKPGRDGVVTAREVASRMGDGCAVVSVMAANNETGVVQPTGQIVRAAHAGGALAHVDAVQAFCRIPLDGAAEADAVSVAAHKVGGPVGMGAVAIRRACPFRPQTFGGGQESGRRPGTQDVAGAVTFAAAAQAASRDLAATRELVAARAQHVYDRLCADGTGIVPTTGAVVDTGRLPGMVSVMVPGVDSQTLVLALDERGFEVSAGSACASGSLDPSHVLSAMGIARDEALGSLRISFDERMDERSLDAFCDCLLALVRDMRGLS